MKHLSTLFAVFLCSCSMPFHMAEVYYPNGQLAKRETDINPSIGGVHSQKGADGYQADDDNQQSFRDGTTAAGTAYSIGQTSKATINANDNKTAQQVDANNAQTTQLKNASDAATADKALANKAANDQALINSGHVKPN